MKIGILALCLLLLSGCSGNTKEIDRGLALRARLLETDAVSFDAQVTADYGDKAYLFGMHCQGDREGVIRFTVTEPESISGITGTTGSDGGNLTFDDTALHIELLTDEQLSPVSAPWIFLQTLRSGYLTSAGMEDDLLRLTIDDSYEEDALQVDIWVNPQDIPVRSEILYDGKRILSLSVTDFQIL